MMTAHGYERTPVLFERHGYRGDSKTYDDMQNANLTRVIDRRKGADRGGQAGARALVTLNFKRTSTAKLL